MKALPGKELAATRLLCYVRIRLSLYGTKMVLEGKQKNFTLMRGRQKVKKDYTKDSSVYWFTMMLFIISVIVILLSMNYI